jgi:hypothetical protein
MASYGVDEGAESNGPAVSETFGGGVRCICVDSLLSPPPSR